MNEHTPIQKPQAKRQSHLLRQSNSFRDSKTLAITPLHDFMNETNQPQESICLELNKNHCVICLKEDDQLKNFCMCPQFYHSVCLAEQLVAKYSLLQQHQSQTKTQLKCDACKEEYISRISYRKKIQCSNIKNMSAKAAILLFIGSLFLLISLIMITIFVNLVAQNVISVPYGASATSAFVLVSLFLFRCVYGYISYLTYPNCFYQLILTPKK